MSIRVTKEGKLPEPKKTPLYRGKCDRCGCCVEVSSEDLQAGCQCLCPTEGCGHLIKCSALRGDGRQRYVDTDKVKYQRGEE